MMPRSINHSPSSPKQAHVSPRYKCTRTSPSPSPATSRRRRFWMRQVTAVAPEPINSACRLCTSVSTYALCCVCVLCFGCVRWWCSVPGSGQSGVWVGIWLWKGHERTGRAAQGPRQRGPRPPPVAAPAAPAHAVLLLPTPQRMPPARPRPRSPPPADAERMGAPCLRTHKARMQERENTHTYTNRYRTKKPPFLSLPLSASLVHLELPRDVALQLRRQEVHNVPACRCVVVGTRVLWICGLCERRGRGGGGGMGCRIQARPHTRPVPQPHDTQIIPPQKDQISNNPTTRSPKEERKRAHARTHAPPWPS